MNGFIAMGRKSPKTCADRISGTIRRVQRRLCRALGVADRRAQEGPGESILLFTPGKVGTNALRQGLRDAGLVVHKAHTLNRDVLRTRIARDRASRGRPLHTDRAALRFVESIQPGLPEIKTMTLVRETIGRNMSGFFQTLWRHGYEPPYEGVKVDELIALFFDKFNHMREDAWFEREFGPALGVRPFATAFDPEQGFGEFRVGRYHVLLLQIELGNDRIAGLSSAFVHRRVGLQPANTGSEKLYGQLYASFKQCIVFPDDYLDRQLSGPVMTTFYSAAQREHIRRYYRREIPGLFPLPRISPP